MRAIVKAYGNKMVGLEDWKSAFQQYADVSLDQFFEQWLQWQGAPELDSSLLDTNTIEIRQVQEGEPYCLDLAVKVQFKDGTSSKGMVQFGAEAHVMTFDKAVESFQVDPD